jgi:hypothetical protein
MRCELRRALVQVFGAAVVAGLVFPVSADASGGGPTLRVAFRDSGRALGLVTSSRYVFIERPRGSAGVVGTLVDELTGKRKQIPLSPGCGTSGQSRIDGPWLVVESCGPQSHPVTDLYSLATGRWRAVSASPSLNPCSSCDAEITPVDAGRHWVGYFVLTCPNTLHGCRARYTRFQNLDTGAVVNDPTGGRTIADLNSPRLARRVCSPLRVPWAGALTFDGKFAVARGTTKDGTPEIWLERCGSSRRLVLLKQPDTVPTWGSNGSAVVWGSRLSALGGVFLPSLSRFTVPLPKAAITGPCSAGSAGHGDVPSCTQAIGLTGHKLYVLANRRLWTANTPRAPR